MNAPLGAPTRRVTIVLYADDCAQLERRFGRGWTEQVRRLVRIDCKSWRKHRQTLEQLMETRDAD